MILEEIAMHEDEPGDEVHDVFAEAIYGNHPLGRLISGTPESVTPMTRNQINTFYRKRYRAPEIVIATSPGLRSLHRREDAAIAPGARAASARKRA